MPEAEAQGTVKLQPSKAVWFAEGKESWLPSVGRKGVESSSSGTCAELAAASISGGCR